MYSWKWLLLETADVQSVSICQVNGTHIYTVQCGYVMGSTDLGCIYSVLKDGIRENGTSRGNNDGVNIELADSACCIEVLACDWEREDDTTCTLPVRARVDSSSTIAVCPSTDETGK